MTHWIVISNDEDFPCTVFGHAHAKFSTFLPHCRRGERKEKKSKLTMNLRFRVIKKTNNSPTCVKCPVFNVVGSLWNTWLVISLYQCSTGSRPVTWLLLLFELHEQKIFSPYAELLRCNKTPRLASILAHSSACLHNRLLSLSGGTPCLDRNSLCAFRQSSSKSLYIERRFTGDGVE